MTILSRLDELKKIADAATAGPWSPVSSLPVYAVSAKAEFGHYDVVTATGREYARYASRQKHGSKFEDADFIAASRTAMPQLIEALRVAVEGLKAGCCCPGETDWKTNAPIICDECEATARIAQILEVGE